METSVRSENGDAAILDRVKTFKSMFRIPPSTMNSKVKSTLPFDQNDFFRGDFTVILPLVILVVPYPHHLSLVIRKDQCDRKRVRLRIDAVIVAQRKGPVESRMRDGPPEVDDLEAMLEELGDIGGRKVPLH